MKKKFIKLIILFGCLAVIFTLASNAMAFADIYNQFLNQAGRVGTYNTEVQSQPNFINTFTGKIVTVALSFIGVIFLILIIYSGIQWLTAGGNEEAVSKAKTRVINGVIGLAITLCAFILTNMLFYYLSQKFLGPKPGEIAPPTEQQNQ